VVPWESAERIACDSVTHEGGGAWASVQYPSGRVVRVGPWDLVTRPEVVIDPQDAAPFPGLDRGTATAIPGGEWAIFPPGCSERARQWAQQFGAHSVVWRDYSRSTAELLRC
jgi:hypothetical protein